jgi:hypothetical protein
MKTDYMNFSYFTENIRVTEGRMLASHPLQCHSKSSELFVVFHDTISRSINGKMTGA